MNIYRYAFSLDPASTVTKGQVAGYLHLSNRDQLTIRTGDAEVQKVVNLACGDTATTGNYRLTYRGYKTDVLAYNANTATIKTAIESLKPFKDNATTVTVSGALSADDVDITYGGQLALEEPDDLIYIEPYLMENAGGVLQYDSTLDTAYKSGFPSGSNSYTVTVSGVKIQRLRADNGKLTVYSS